MALIRLVLGLGLFCVCFHALSQAQTITVTGTLTRMMAVGGESTGWAIQLDSETSVDGKSVRTLEIDFGNSQTLEKLQNQRVQAVGKLSRRTGVETGVRSVLAVSSFEAAASPSVSSGDLTLLFSRIWRVTDAPSKPASGSIYVFLPNGTLLQTSCAESYRIARWSIDKAHPSVLRVVEDGQLAYTTSITSLTGQTLQLKQELARGHETRNLALAAVEREFVCPDLPK